MYGAGAALVRVWVGQAENNSSIIPLAILYSENLVWRHNTTAKILNFLTKTKLEWVMIFLNFFNFFFLYEYFYISQLAYLTFLKSQAKFNK